MVCAVFAAMAPGDFHAKDLTLLSGERTLPGDPKAPKDKKKFEATRRFSSEHEFLDAPLFDGRCIKDRLPDVLSYDP